MAEKSNKPRVPDYLFPKDQRAAARRIKNAMSEVPPASNEQRTIMGPSYQLIPGSLDGLMPRDPNFRDEPLTARRGTFTTSQLKTGGKPSIGEPHKSYDEKGGPDSKPTSPLHSLNSFEAEKIRRKNGRDVFNPAEESWEAYITRTTDSDTRNPQPIDKLIR